MHIHGKRPGISLGFRGLMERLISELRTLTKIGLFAFFGSGFAHIFGVKSKESQGYKFGSIKAFNKAVDVRQSKMLITLPSDAVSGEITGTGLDFKAPLAKIFSESTNTRTKHSQKYFSQFITFSLCLLISIFHLY